MAADEKKILMHQLVHQVRATEAVLLERSRQNLLVMKPTLCAGKGMHLVPCVLSTFSVALVVTGTFLNACMGSSRLFISNTNHALEVANRLGNMDDDAFRNIVSWRIDQAGIPVPWLEHQLAEVQAILEMYEEQQRSIVSPHLLTVNKILEISGMLANSGRSLVVAIWAYVANSFTVSFAQNMVDDLIGAIDQSPESFKQLAASQCVAERKIAEISAAISEFTSNRKCPDGVIAVALTKERSDSAALLARASLLDYANTVIQLRSATIDFDKAMASMARGLPSFVRSLLKFVAIWNKESPHLAQRD